MRNLILANHGNIFQELSEIELANIQAIQKEEARRK